MIMKLILLSNLLIVSAYNIDTNYPVLYPNNATNMRQYLHTRFADSYYGYSTLLHRDSQKNTTWLFVGAPRGNHTRPSRNQLLHLDEPGVVYQCKLPGPCIEIEPAVVEDEMIYLRQLQLHGKIKKKRSWFGAAMSIERSSDFLTICAPRTIMSIILSDAYVDTMEGICYNNRMPLTTLDVEISNIKDLERKTCYSVCSYNRYFDTDECSLFRYKTLQQCFPLLYFRKKSWFNAMYGFSVTFAPSQGRTISRIVGSPMDDVSGTVTMMRLIKHNFHEIFRKTTDLVINHDLSHFGYSVTSGYYFNRTQFLYASADPGWNYVGQVGIMDPDGDPFMVANLQGNDIGEYFGASLATGDLNKDGLHDLIIGAPHWGNDNGRVHIYLGSLERKFKAVAILEGINEDAQFGYAIASGDLDGDGFSDIIVGAPWEESGAIYIYNGDASLQDKVRPIMSQRITMQLPTYTLPKSVNIRPFGFSITEPIDIDNNGYMDIAVGAYKSGHVILLRTRPVVRTNLIVHTAPNTLQRNTRNFLIKVCVEYRDYDVASIHAFKISLIIDARYKRTKKTSLELFSMDPPLNMCVNTSITLLDNIQDFIEPITIYASHNFMHNDSSMHDFCNTCPVESKGIKSRGVQTVLPFDIGCGEDRICNSNISATMEFLGLRNNDSWVIGSNDIALKTHLINYGEPAYLTTIIFTFPHGIVLRSILPTCEENTEEITLVVICNVGNPLGTNEQRIVKLDLDMRHLTDGSLHGQILKFSAQIQTRSANYGIRMIKSTFTLQSEASLSLNGKVNEMSYYLSNLDKEQLNVSFQHTYQILKFGATPIKEAQLLVGIPTAVNNISSLVFLYKPRIYISGQYYDCTSNGIELVDTQQNELQEETDVTNLNTYLINSNNDTMRNVTHELHKRDINSHTFITARIIHALYGTGTENPDSNTTTQDIAYLNCSTYNVNCSFMYCDLSALKTQEDMGKLAIRLILNATKLKGINWIFKVQNVSKSSGCPFNDAFGLSDETKIVKFNTEAYVKITQPANRIPSTADTRPNMNLTTEFYCNSTAKTQELQLWVVLVSVSLGLILLCIVIIILSMVGFFKRTSKEELSALKMNEITADINKAEITDESK